MTGRAPAKINLGLGITGKRQDGYHELDSIFLPIDWFDIVKLELRESPEQRVTLRCSIAELAYPDSNLASRAALAFLKEYSREVEVAIEVEKHIPVGAGLGGGSSDAGIVLRMLASLFDVAVDSRLRRIAAGLGADVPFFLDPAPARVRGIGEIIERLASAPRIHLVIAVPSVQVPTGRIFGALTPSDWSGAPGHGFLQAFADGEASRMVIVNDLERPAIELYPQIGNLKAILQEEGAIASSMSGSGGAVFGIFEDRKSAQLAAGRIVDREPSIVARAVSTLGFESERLLSTG